VGQIKVVPEVWPRYRPSHPVRVNFAGVIALTGYDLTPHLSGSASPFTLTLYWQSLAPVAEDYVVFVHLLDSTGRVIDQADAPPTGNSYPTRWWSSGEMIADPHPLPPAPGTTALRLGLYQLQSGQRLPVVEATLPGQDNSVEIPWP
jgi:hypothetical protein